MFSAQGSQVSDNKLYVDDVFSAYTYTGNGSTQSIVNGIDLVGKGGMVWTKSRTSTTSYNILIDTIRGVTSYVFSNSTAADPGGSNAITSFNSNGYALGAISDVNQMANTFVGWTFRKAPKFFDVVTYTGNGVAGRTVPHSLGVAPGMMLVKCTSNAATWVVYHRANTANPETDYLQLNTTDATLDFDGVWNDTAPSASVFTLGSNGIVNGNTFTYVAYLFAHDISTDGIVQCGSFTTDGSGNATVNLGWEPQYLMFKCSSAVENWSVFDTSRAFPASPSTAATVLVPNTASAEAAWSVVMGPTATGFIANSLGASKTYIYMAIRRPNKPPTVGTQVYNAIARTGTGAAATVTGVGFAPDLAIYINRPHNAISNSYESDRLRGTTKTLATSTTGGEQTFTTAVTSFDMDGMTLGTDAGNNLVNGNTYSYINYFFKRAPGVMDIVCYTGTGVAKTEVHNLGVVPELMIVKGRSNAGSWWVYSGNPTKVMWLDATNGLTTFGNSWNSTNPTSSVFTIGTSGEVNASGSTFVAYLFATKAGISKVGSYTGNGSSQTINCGFSTGARFIMIKRTDAAGDWFIWDTARGIVAGNDPHLSLNSTVAEVTTDDSIDPDTSGFIVNQVAATNINVTSATYIFLAFS